MERADRLVERRGILEMERLTRSHVAGDMLRTSKSSLANGTLVVATHDVCEDIDRAEKDDGLVLGGYLIPYSNPRLVKPRKNAQSKTSFSHASLTTTPTHSCLVLLYNDIYSDLIKPTNPSVGRTDSTLTNRRCNSPDQHL